MLESLKRHYRKSLLRELLLSVEQLDIVEFLKQVNMKVVAETVAVAWDQITTTTIRRSWRKLLPIEDEDTMDGDHDNEPTDSDFVDNFQRLGQELDESDVSEWLAEDATDVGYEHLDDAGIVAHVLHGDRVLYESDDEMDTPVVCPISHGDAIDLFDKCLTWLYDQPEASAYNTSVLLSLRDLAAKKRFTLL